MITYPRFFLYSLLLSLCASSHLNAYINREDAIRETILIVVNLFSYNIQDNETRQKIDDFIGDFNSSTFMWDTDYSQFNNIKVANLVIDNAAEWIRHQAILLTIKEIMSFYRYNYTISFEDQEKLKIIVGNALKNQVQRETKKVKDGIEDSKARYDLHYKPIRSMQEICRGALEPFIGDKLKKKVREQIVQVLQRDCAIPICGNEHEQMQILDCGHKLHPTCLNSMKRAQRDRGLKVKCPQCNTEIKEDNSPWNFGRFFINARW
jgi:hypothetical protein